MTQRKLAYVLASLVVARRNCHASGNAEWFYKHTEKAAALVREYMPSGSGFDVGTKIDFERSGGQRLTFTTSFHHMNDVGMYDGWTEHVVTVRPHFIGGLQVKVAGPNRNDIKDHIAECFEIALSQIVEG